MNIRHFVALSMYIYIYIYIRVVGEQLFFKTYFIKQNAVFSINKKQIFEANSLLQFTHEIGTRDNINFPDVQVSTHEDGYQTAVSPKPTNSGIYLHYDSECPQRYNPIKNYCGVSVEFRQIKAAMGAPKQQMLPSF